MELTKLLGRFFWIFLSFLAISCQDDEVIDPGNEDGDGQEPDTEVVNLALGKTVETKVNDLNGQGSNPKMAGLITDGDSTTYWESADSYKHSILIDLGGVQEVSKIVVRWADGRGCNAYNINFGKERDKITNVVGKNNVKEDKISTFEGFREEARYVEFVVRGRLDYKGGYRIAEIEVYNENNEEHVNTPEEQKAIDTITERLRADYLNDDPDEKGVGSFMNSMQPDGSWSDIDYDDQISVDGWKPEGHLNRLRTMAINYSHPKSSFYNNPTLLEKIERGLLFFKQKAPVSSDNWYYNDIGAPQKYMVPVLLIKGSLPRKNMMAVSVYLKDKIEGFIGGGKNLSWIAEIAMHKGCAEDNYSTVQHSFNAIASTLAIVPKQGDEGIKIDGSYHQHHAQIQSGSYGMSLVDDISQFMEISAETPFANEFTSEKKEIFHTMLLDGTLLLSYRQAVDFGTRGRNVARPSTGYTTISKDVLRKLAVGDPDNAGMYNGWINHIEKGSAFPKPNVNKHFWKSDMMTQHGEEFYLSAKIISKRTYGTESLNQENLKAFNLPLGSTNIMTTGNEYNDIFPVWDWTRIPGTTAINNQDKTVLNGYQIGNNEFGGGASNNLDGIMAFSGEYNGLQANKAYFFIDNMMICMGSGISCHEGEEILTSVEQNFLNGMVVYNDGEEKQLDSDGDLQGKQLKWVHHNNTGYIFDQADNVTMRNNTQTGSWKEINGTGKSDLISKKVFSLWFNHGVNPIDESYRYIVVPGQSLSSFRTLVDQVDLQVAQNSSVVQAIRKNNKYGFVFYQKGSVTMDDDLKVSVDKPAIVLIEKNDSRYHITVSDPTYTQSDLTLSLNKKLEAVDGVTLTEEGCNVAIKLPTDDYQGSSITKSYMIK